MWLVSFCLHAGNWYIHTMCRMHPYQLKIVNYRAFQVMLWLMTLCHTLTAVCKYNVLKLWFNARSSGKAVPLFKVISADAYTSARTGAIVNASFQITFYINNFFLGAAETVQFQIELIGWMADWVAGWHCNTFCQMIFQEVQQIWSWSFACRYSMVGDAVTSELIGVYQRARQWAAAAALRIPVAKEPCSFLSVLWHWRKEGYLTCKKACCSNLQRFSFPV